MSNKIKSSFGNRHGFMLSVAVLVVAAAAGFSISAANNGAGAAYITGVVSSKYADPNWYKHPDSLGFAVSSSKDYKAHTGLRFIAQVGNTRDASVPFNLGFERGQMSLFLVPSLTDPRRPFSSKTNDIQGTFTYMDTAGNSLTVPQMSHKELNDGDFLDTDKGIILKSKRAWLNGQPAEVELHVNHAFDSHLTVSNIMFRARYISAKAGQDFVNVSYNSNANLAVDTGAYFMADSTILWGNAPLSPAPSSSPALGQKK
jgi:hypothetical protein